MLPLASATTKKGALGTAVLVSAALAAAWLLFQIGTSDPLGDAAAGDAPGPEQGTSALSGPDTSDTTEDLGDGDSGPAGEQTPDLVLPSLPGAEVSPERGGWEEVRARYAEMTGPRGSMQEESLQVHDGRLNITTPGTVIDGMHLTSHVNVYAPDVTIKNSLITGHLRFHNGADNGLVTDTIVRHAGPYVVRNSGARNLVLQHCEIDGLRSPDNNGGVTGSNLTVRYCDFHSHTDSAKVGSNSVWEYNHLHGNGRWLDRVHVDGLQSTGSTNVQIRHNLIEMPGFSSAMHFQATFGPIRDITIEHNYLNGGSYTVYVRSDTNGHGDPHNVRIANNRMGRDYTNGLFSTRGDVTQVDNVWHDTGTPA
jgi:hypothetical protein